MTDTTYHGWKNWATWNVALWLSNDELLYKLARRCVRYVDFADRLEEMETFQTPDGASYNDPDLDINALDELLLED
jgi:hypothetical protein